MDQAAGSDGAAAGSDAGDPATLAHLEPGPGPTPEPPGPNTVPSGHGDGRSPVEADPTAAAVEGGPGRRRIGLLIALPVLIMLAGFVWIAATAGQPDATAASPLLGKPAPPVAGETVQGGRFDLRDMQGRWVVVNYFATWCPQCRVEHPELDRFSKVHEAQADAAVVSVVFNDRPKAVREFLAENGGNWPMVIDPGGQIALNYGVGKVPESYLVSPDGYVVAKIVGGVQGQALEALLQRAKTARADGPPR